MQGLKVKTFVMFQSTKPLSNLPSADNRRLQRFIWTVPMFWKRVCPGLHENENQTECVIKQSYGGLNGRCCTPGKSCGQRWYHEEMYLVQVHRYLEGEDRDPRGENKMKVEEGLKVSLCDG